MLNIEIAEPLRSVLPDLQRRFRAEGWWSDETFGTHAERHAADDPHALILRDDHGVLSRAKLVESAKRLAGALARRGLGRGSVVGLQLPSSTHYGVANLACELLGAMWVNLPPSYRRHELVEILGHLHADAVVGRTVHGGFDYRPLIAEVRAEVPSLQHVIAADDAGADGWVDLSDLLAEPFDEALIDPLRLDGDGIYSILLSSGTTSARPKEALRSVNSMVSALSIMNRTLQITPADRIMCLAPQTGGTGYSYSVAVPLLTGALADVTEHGMGPDLVARIAASRPTVLVAVPTQMSRLLDESGGDRSMWSELRLIVNSGAPLLGDVAARAEDECGCPIISVYGATDGLVPVMTPTDAPPAVRHSRVGRVLPGHQVRIVDDDGADVPPGTVGEICGFGPGMAFGYVDNATEMARAWDADGWWHSGDLGILDDDGYLGVVGRKKEMILRGGVNISPLEIEELLGQHPAVVEAAVVAMPHERLLEQACAFVVTRDGTELTLDDVTEFLLGRGLAKFKLPERVEVRAVIPRTNAQKIDKLALKAEIASILESEHGAAGS